MDYKRQDDLDRRVAADKLAELTEELVQASAAGGG
jgi:hypothetical protein